MAATGKTIHSEAREVVNHVISCVNKKQSRKVILPICGADKRTPEYCVVLVGTIAGIRKESKKKVKEVFCTNQKRRLRNLKEV